VTGGLRFLSLTIGVLGLVVGLLRWLTPSPPLRMVTRRGSLRPKDHERVYLSSFAESVLTGGAPNLVHPGRADCFELTANLLD
jgi:hypothetical protein